MEGIPEVSIDESLQIPVIDMSKLATDHVEYQNEKARVHQACKEWGVFQLINHGATTVVEKMKEVTQDFFKLPLDQKMACAQRPNGNDGYFHTFAAPHIKLEYGEMFFLFSLPVSQRNVRIWPNTPTAFRSTCDEFSVELDKICKVLVHVMATNLGVNPEIVNSMYEDGTQTIRMMHYPPTDGKVIHLKTHTDIRALTLLIQVNEVDGLQIKKDGNWVLVKALPGAIIANIGDVMEVMTNGEYRSLEHRAVVNVQKERTSVAVFHGPNMTTKVGPLPDLIKEKGANYMTLANTEFTRLFYNRKNGEQSLVDHMRINN